MELINVIRPGDFYVLSFDQTAYFSIKDSGTREVKVRGELRLRFDYDRWRNASWAGDPQGPVWINLALGPSEKEKGQLETGKFDLQSWSRDAGADLLEVGKPFSFTTVHGEMAYEWLVEKYGYEKVGSHLYVSPREAFIGTLTGTLAIEGTELYFQNGNLDLSFDTEGGNVSPGLVSAVSVPLLSGRFVLAARYDPESPAPGPAGMAQAAMNVPAGNASSQSGWVHKCRTLRIQPVLFSKDNETTGGDKTRQISAAGEIWREACFKLEEETAHSIANRADLFDCSDPSLVANCYNAPNGAIPVFFVANDLIQGNNGGGVTFDRGTALAKVVVSDNTRFTEFGVAHSNPNLLAHEMGHVLGGSDHNEQQPGLWQGQTGSVMQAFNSPWLEISSCNTEDQCRFANNTAQWLDPEEDCRLTPSCS